MAAVLKESFEKVRRTQVEVGNLVINFDTRQVTFDGKPVKLDSVEYGLLERLASAKGEIVSKRVLLEHALGPGKQRSKGYLKVYICKLRKILEVASGGEDYIKTFHKRGYMLRLSPVSAN